MRPCWGLRHRFRRLQLELCPLTCRLSIKNEARQTLDIATNLSRALTIGVLSSTFGIFSRSNAKSETVPAAQHHHARSFRNPAAVWHHDCRMCYTERDFTTREPEVAHSLLLDVWRHRHRTGCLQDMAERGQATALFIGSVGQS